MKITGNAHKILKLMIFLSELPVNKASRSV